MSKVHNLSAKEIALEASDLARQWPTLEPEEKRKVVEAITERIVIGKGEIAITFHYLPACTEMAKRWRKGGDSNPR